MDFLLAFLEGVISFISPCLLPMLPLYIVYFAGGESGNKKTTIINAISFVLGFSLVFVSLGVFSGIVGSFLVKNRNVMNIISGILVTILGLNYLGVFNIKFLNHNQGRSKKPVKITGAGSAISFGIIFAITWTPCVGSFLGAALTMAASTGSALHGAIMLLCYSIGMGIPFILSAVLIDRLKTTFDFIKKHYDIINKVSGLILIIMGILMMTGVFARIMAMISGGIYG